MSLSSRAQRLQTEPLIREPFGKLRHILLTFSAVKGVSSSATNAKSQGIIKLYVRENITYVGSAQNSTRPGSVQVSMVRPSQSNVPIVGKTTRQAVKHVKNERKHHRRPSRPGWNAQDTIGYLRGGKNRRCSPFRG